MNTPRHFQEKNILSPYSAQVIDTLRNILAPGKQIRISPFIEAAQYKCLFDEVLEPASRYEQMQEIFKKHDSLLDKLAVGHAQFVSGSKKFTGSYTKESLDQYMIYYFPVNIAKLQLMMLELLEREEFNAEIRIIDIGVGSGTTVLALFDFLIAWATVCNLYDLKFPISSVHYTAIDNSHFCLQYADKAMQAFAHGLRKRGEFTGNPVYTQVVEWLDNCKWIQEDINNSCQQITGDKKQTFLIASNVLNELTPVGVKRVETLFTGLTEGSYALIIEPGDKAKTNKLNNWRKNLLIENPQIATIAPCGQEHNDFLQCRCENCWNARRESLTQTPLYKKFRDKYTKFVGDKRKNSFDDYQNNLLSWSYYILQIRNDGDERETPFIQRAEGIKRYIGTFAQKAPVSPSPGDSLHISIDEYLKFCPGASQGSKFNTVVIKRKPGMQCPDVQHGELVNFKSIETSPQDIWGDVEALQFSPEESALIELVPLGRRKKENVFLKSYSSLAKSAVDDIGFRLFGFPAMRAFQHTILKRVLQGGNILGIAATGGGKSECYILPAMLLPGITIVIAPLISLIQDQFEQRIRDRYGLEGVTTYINSGLSFQERQARLKRLTLGYYKIIYLTPEQLEKSYILNCLQEADQKHTIRYLALDESHCISQWGHDFRPAYLNMVSRLKLWKIQPTRIALTATASPEVRHDLCEELGLKPEPLDLGGDVFLHSSNRHELNLIAKTLPDMHEKSAAILDALKQLSMQNKRSKHKGAAIVFFPYTGGSPEYTYKYLPDEVKKEPSQKGKLSAGVTPFASYIERQLQQRVSIYHGKMENGKVEGTIKKLGDLSGRTRQSQQKGFIDGNTDIMVATKGFGMGIDKPNIRLVIHRTPTSNLEAYAQEAGRAGRDGEIADCLLFYSPDSQDEDQGNGKSEKILSDHDIQTRFLSDKYIRQDDMVVMFHFLRLVERKINEHLYFTNDEAIGFFEQCSKKPETIGLASYAWPDFQKRETGLYENQEEIAILERGHYYQEKTKYIDRILSVAYRIRPKIEGERICFIKELQETGASFSNNKVEIINAQCLVQSNAYFGSLFRDKGLSDKDLASWLSKCAKTDFMEFAEFLGLSLRETNNLFQDIKRADGCFTRDGSWRSKLLNFGAITSPQYGPAHGKVALDEWRSYAGATRCNRKAYSEAKQEKRKPTLDERFPWATMPYPKGWEVRLGSAFDQVENFKDFLRTFMQIHDEREKNDWAAYNRLLSDYVGVGENGRIKEKDDRKCLRSVMLGYLKTYEVVEGGSCLSCNVCVPDEKFEIDLEKRKQVVVKLNEQIAEFIEYVEKTWEVLPDENAVNSFWKSVQLEAAAGRSIIGYIEGATGRMLDDNPAHRPALYIRLIGMQAGYLPMSRKAFTANVRSLINHCSEEETVQVWKKCVQEIDVLLPNNNEAIEIKALTLHKLKKYEEEAEVRAALVKQLDAQDKLYHSNSVALSQLHSPEGPVPDHEKFCYFTLRAARSGTNLDFIDYYSAILKNWEWARLLEEIIWLKENSLVTNAAVSLLDLWYKEFNTSEITDHICEALSEKALVENWPAIWSSAFFENLSITKIEESPDLLDHYLVAVERYNLEPRPEIFLHDVIGKIHHGDSISSANIEKFAALFFETLTHGEREQSLEKGVSVDALFPQKLIKLLSLNYLADWLKLFESYLDRSDFKLALNILFKLFEHSKSQLKDILLQNVNLIESISILLLGSENYQEQTHGIWFSYCDNNHDTTILSFYFTCLLKSRPIKEKFLEETCGLLLKNVNEPNELIFKNIEATFPTEIEWPDSILGHLLEFRFLIQTLKRESDIEAYEKLGAGHFHSIFTVFKPETTIHRADMTVSILIALRSHLIASWLTPVSYLVEALGLARRFDEASDVAAKYSELKIGRDQVPVDAFLKNLIAKNSEERQKSKSIDLFNRLARDEVREWQVAKQRRRWQVKNINGKVAMQSEKK